MAELIERARKNHPSLELSYSDEQQRQIDAYNALPGELDGYDCKDCKNRGYIAVMRKGEMSLTECRCMPIRRSLARIRKSGINEFYTLGNFQAREDWQKVFCRSAYSFVALPTGWFFAGGQVGCGKTHICTGIVRKLIETGKEARYMLWRDESTVIKASVKYPEEYAALVEPLKTVDVLYLDDFLKTNNGQPTIADFNLAFEILNARYNRTNLITIISSEFYLDEIVDMDEAVGSRIFERARYYINNIQRDKRKNYRIVGIAG